MFFSKLNKNLIDQLAIESLYQTLNTNMPGLSISGEELERYKKSIEFLKGTFSEAFEIGKEFSCVESDYAFEMLRQKGRVIENKLINLTDTRTHIGALFCLSLMSAAAGRIDALGLDFELEYLIATIAAFTKGYSYKSFINIGLKSPPLTLGEELYKTTGLLSIRGLAEQGFDTVLSEGLKYLDNNFETEQLFSGLFLLMISLADDSRLILKHGIQVSAELKEKARAIALNYNNDAVTELDKNLKSKGIVPKAAMGLHSLCLFTKKLLAIKN